LGGYTSLDCIPVEVKKITPNIITLESCQLFPAVRYNDSETFKGFAKEATTKSLMGHLVEYVNTHDCTDIEYVPETDSVRVRVRLRVAEFKW
jgi:hypothetical protein